MNTEQKKVQQAMAAGAQLVVELLGNHPTRPTALAYITGLGGLSDTYDGSDPVSEMLGVDGILKHCRETTGHFIGNAPSARNAIQERIDAARRKDQLKAAEKPKRGDFERPTKSVRTKPDTQCSETMGG